MSAKLDYATGTTPGLPPPRAWRWVARVGTVLLLVAGLAGIVTTIIGTVRPGGSDADQVRMFLSVRLSPEKVVYEEDPARAAVLLALPADPQNRYRGAPPKNPPLPQDVAAGDYRSATYTSAAGNDGSGGAEFVPRFFQWTFGRQDAGGLVFVHERVAADGSHRLVTVTQAKSFVSGSSDAPNAARTALILRVRSDSPDAAYKTRGGERHGRLRVELGPRAIARLYAGQVDPANDARFTIKYEIDDVPGTIEGVLQPDDSVTLKVLDGPAVNSWKPLP